MSWEFQVNEVGAGGDFEDIPDDLYDARIMDVQGPNEGTAFDGTPRTELEVTFELLPTADQVEYGCPAEATRKYWINLTPRFMGTGIIGETSKLYAFLTTIGFDLSQPTTLNTDSWIDRRCRVQIKHTEKGYPKITDILAPRQKAAPARTPVGAAAGRAPLRSRLQAEEDD